MRRMLTAIALTLAVVLTPSIALADDELLPTDPAAVTAEEVTVAPTTTGQAPVSSAAPTSAAPSQVTLLDLLEALYGEGAFDGCCGTTPALNTNPYVPPPNTLTPPPTQPRVGPYTVPSYSQGSVAAGGGTGSGRPSVAGPSGSTSALGSQSSSAASPTAPGTDATCVPNALRGQPGYQVRLDPDGDNISCEPYVEPVAAAVNSSTIPADDGDPPVVALAVAAVAAGVLLWALAGAPRPPRMGRHRRS